MPARHTERDKPARDRVFTHVEPSRKIGSSDLDQRPEHGGRGERCALKLMPGGDGSTREIGTGVYDESPRRLVSGFQLKVL